MTRFYDTVPMTGLRTTSDGYLVGEAPVARAGVQVYAGYEVGRPDLAVVRVYRPPEEVFSQDALRSYAHRPITVGHPSEKVTADNWKDLAAGQTGDEVVRDGDVVRVPLVLMDANAIRKHQTGVRELSMGYDAEIEFSDGTTPDGDAYDAIQRNQRMNHLALVARARGGERLRLGDETDDGGTTMTTEASKLRTVTLDGLPIETTDAGAKAIERLQGDVQTARQALTDAETNHATAIQAKDKEIAQKDAEIDELKGKILTDEQLDERVKTRADLLDAARKVADADYAGKTDAEIRRLAVATRLGDAAVKDKTEAYVDARFEILLEDAGRDNPANEQLRRRVNAGDSGDSAKNGQTAYERRMADAWKTGGQVATSKEA